MGITSARPTLEEETVPGVRVDHQLGVGEQLGHDDGIDCGNHDVVVAIGNEHRNALVRIRTEHAGSGWVIDDSTIWSASGRLLALARQARAVRPGFRAVHQD